ncbi:MAG: hypothetical protein ACOYW9_15795 [Deinococcota bacterium]
MKIRIAGTEVEYSAFGEGLEALSDPPTRQEETALAALFAAITAQGLTPQKVESYRCLGMAQRGRFLLRSTDPAGHPKEHYGRLVKGKALLEG